MCGIVGIVAKSSENVVPSVFQSLQRLEYRGYDSSGIATIDAGKLICRRASGKLSQLAEVLDNNSTSGSIAIGHTRWATHGLPTTQNAHPHATDAVAVVHNGIIENYQPLKERLIAEGVHFQSDTDSEVVPQLLTHYLKNGLQPLEAIKKVVSELEGAFALAIIFAQEPDTLYTARLGSPLALGRGADAMYVGSDAIALAPLCQYICYLEDGDIAALSASGVTTYDASGIEVERSFIHTTVSGAAVGKDGHRHFMHKEIHEQPTILGELFNIYVNPTSQSVVLPDMHLDISDINHLTFVACGTSYYAALVMRYHMERHTGLRVDLDIASEFRYREPPLDKHNLVVFISQSGETADTLAALRYCKTHQAPTLAIVNVQESAMAREADAALFTYAGPEIGVASSKAFTSQILTLACFCVWLATSRNTLNNNDSKQLLHALSEVSSLLHTALSHEDDIASLAQSLMHVEHMLYIGRGTSFALAHEAALKMKEISYIHAEAYAAGEMKHGPIALLDDDLPVIVIAPNDHWFEKTFGNVQEALARGARVIVFCEETHQQRLQSIGAECFVIPACHPFVSPILYSIPIQLLAYHVAVLKGTDVDQPRNLAKSVTVE